jgi:uncharacterized protein (TIGR03000 family)
MEMDATGVPETGDTAPMGTGTPAESGTSSGTGATGASQARLPRTSALIVVRVPENAKVTVNGFETKSTGPERQFVSQGLQAGLRYKYEVTAEFEVDGQLVSDTKVVKLVGGQRSQIRLGASRVESSEPKIADQRPETKLVVRVPEEARVFLAGSPTESTGAIREFVTTRLSQGQEWAGYTVRAVVERDGEPVVQEKTLNLQAGSNYELSFDFEMGEAAKVASR